MTILSRAANQCEPSVKSVQAALWAIHATALHLLDEESLPNDHRQGLELIVLLSRYKRDVRCTEPSEDDPGPPQ